MAYIVDLVGPEGIRQIGRTQRGMHWKQAARKVRQKNRREQISGTNIRHVVQSRSFVSFVIRGKTVVWCNRVALNALRKPPRSFDFSELISTDDRQLLKARVAALEARVATLPTRIRYRLADGRSVSLRIIDVWCYAGQTYRHSIGVIRGAAECPDLYDVVLASNGRSVTRGIKYNQALGYSQSHLRVTGESTIIAPHCQTANDARG